MTFYRADMKTAIVAGLLASTFLLQPAAYAQVDLTPHGTTDAQPVPYSKEPAQATQPAPSKDSVPEPVSGSGNDALRHDPVSTGPQEATPEPEESQPPATPGDANRADVVTSSLAPIEPLSIALMTPEKGGIAGNVWDNSSAYSLSLLLKNLPTGGQSPALNDLVMRVLKSAGDLVGAAPEQKQALQHARLQALYDLGHLTAVETLVQQSPGGRDDAQAAVHAVNAMLAQGHAQQACDFGERKGAARGGLYWRKLRAFCMAQSGNVQGAELTASLLAQEQDAGPAFQQAILAITAPKVVNPDDKPEAVDTALGLAMAEAANKPVDTNDLPLPLLVGLVTRDTPADPAMTWRAVASGAVPVKTLRDQLLLLGQPQLTPPASSSDARAANPAGPGPDPAAGQRQLLDTARKDETMQGLATLYWLAEKAANAGIRANAIAAIVARPGTPLQRLALFKLVVPAASSISASADLSDVAGAFTRIFLLSDDVDRAQVWSQFVPGPDLKTDNLDVALYALGGKVVLNTASLHDRLYGKGERNTQLLDALLVADTLRHGDNPSIRAALATFTNDDACAVGSLAALRSAAQAGTKGETAMRALSLAGNEPLSALAPTCGAGVVASLQQAGFGAAARTFAMQWLISGLWPDQPEAG